MPRSSSCVRCKAAPATLRSGWCAPCNRLTQREHYAKKSEQKKAATRARYEELRQISWDAKAVPCMDCLMVYPPYVMHFDHRPGEGKVASISRLMAQGNRGAMLEEIKKCDVVCANCHAERTHQRLGEAVEV